jgi:hypothetical protein
MPLAQPRSTSITTLSTIANPTEQTQDGPVRSRNARAQARHRAKRKAYIEQVCCSYVLLYLPLDLILVSSSSRRMSQSSKRSLGLLPSRSRHSLLQPLSPTSSKISRAKISVSAASSTSGARPSRRCLHSSIPLTTAGHQTQTRTVPPIRSSIIQFPSALRTPWLVLPFPKSARFLLTIRPALRRITVSWRVPYSVVPSPPSYQADEWKVADTSSRRHSLHPSPSPLLLLVTF